MTPSGVSQILEQIGRVIIGVANVRFSLRQTSDYNHRMARVYREEWPHFLASLWPATDDPRMGLPQEMVLQLCELLGVDGKGMFED